VCVADCNVAAGDDAAKQFKDKYGDANAIFCNVDVTSQLQFEGNTTTVTLT